MKVSPAAQTSPFSNQSPPQLPFATPARMTVTIPTTLQPISESPERRSASSTPTLSDPRFVRGHARRRSAPPTDPTLDPATALVLAQARLSAAQAETTLQRTAADGLRVANAQLRSQNMDLEERVKELEGLLVQRDVQPLTPTDTASSGGDSRDAINPPNVDRITSPRRLSHHSTATDVRARPSELKDPAAALWKVYADLRSAEARLDTVYTYVRAERADLSEIRDTHWPLHCALQRLQATFARRPR
ncbi:hypothetical protein A1Q2_04555 [Trichosporon asahii var. asahii CBS 8904]|uniref:Uncharacterized protein n=1 Tax=Trichosporon asahii var. asahii (strain CBS 8904) TaxID=1220162 RepID=K1VNL6_TRIAC|nr:hypothetical protein A1Q2_04555 [Trichosporon asahii var. asahii CBS 8904]